MKYFITFLFLIISGTVNAKTIRIAIIDSGINLENNHLTLCKDGLIDLTGTGIQDSLQHGDHIAHIIEDNLIDINHCLIIIKVFSFRYSPNSNVIKKAWKIINTSNVDVVNFSAGGSVRYGFECDAIDYAIDNNKTVVVAAGNNRNNLDKGCNFYPACCSTRVISVGNMKNSYERNNTSNYGERVSAWEIGTKIWANGVTMSGSSQAAAIHTVKLVRKLYEQK